MSDPEAPKIEFPCEYPIKVLGRSSDVFEALVLEVFECHASGFDPNSVTLKASSKGTFSSLNITIIATGRDQLEALHRDLMATGHVNMVI